MQRGFTKLFNTIVTSTIWQEDDKTRIVWITMLAIADADGIVSASIPGLASVANVSVNAARVSVKTLLSPDADSRTKDFDGRRIEEIDGGWRILNYLKYRRMLNTEERKEYKARWIAEKRRQMSTPSRRVSMQSTHAEAEANKEEDKRKRKPLSLAECIAFAKTKGISSEDAEAFWDSMEAGGWTRNGNALKDWKAHLRSYKSNGYLASQRSKNGQRPTAQSELDKRLERDPLWREIQEQKK